MNQQLWLSPRGDGLLLSLKFQPAVAYVEMVQQLLWQVRSREYPQQYVLIAVGMGKAGRLDEFPGVLGAPSPGCFQQNDKDSVPPRTRAFKAGS